MHLVVRAFGREQVKTLDGVVCAMLMFLCNAPEENVESYLCLTDWLTDWLRLTWMLLLCNRWIRKASALVMLKSNVSNTQLLEADIAAHAQAMVPNQIRKLAFSRQQAV